MIEQGARWLGRALLWVLAAAGVAVLAVTLLAALPVTRPLIAAALVSRVDDAIAGSLSLEGIGVLPHGGIELFGVRVLDPEGRLVLRVDRARVLADAARIIRREIGVTLELEGVEVDAALRTKDGGLAIARAFAPTPTLASARTSKAPKEGAATAPVPVAVPGGGWTLRVGRLSIRRAQVRAEGVAAQLIEANGLSLDARGLWGPHGGWGEARLDGAMTSPANAPLTVELRAERRGDAIELQRLAVGLGGDRLEAVGEGNLSRRTGRVALTRLGVSQQEAGAFARAAKLGGELSGTVFAESDGTTATVALTVTPAAAAATGRAQAAFAMRLTPGAFAWGVSADVDRLDPSRITLLAPRGSVTLRGRGAARGGRLADMAGRVVLNVERSRLRDGELGPISLAATAGGGDIEISRLEAAAPGGEVTGRLRWREGRAVEGQLTVVFADLERFGQNVGKLLGTRLPAVEGSGRADVTLSGSSSAPRVVAAVQAPRLAFGGLRTEGARLKIVLEGPEVELSFAAHVSGLGPDPIRADLRGAFGPERRSFVLADLVLAWPGTRFELGGPARLDLVGPAVDRLLLVSGEQRIELTGGTLPDQAVAARLRLVALDLARFPHGLFPPGLSLAGTLNLDARASGTRSAPMIDATIGLTGGSAYEVGGLQVLGDLSWDGALDRIEADLGLIRERGGSVDLSLDLPTALGRARPYEEIRVELRGKAVPLDEIVWMAGSYALVSGDVDLAVTLTGSVGVPELRAGLQVRNGTFEDLEALGAEVTLDATGGRARLEASGTISGAPAATAEAELPLDLPGLLLRPREAVALVMRSPSTLVLGLPDVALTPLAGRLELPRDLAGRVGAEAKLAGTFAAPRGTAWLTIAGGAGWGAREVGGRLELTLAHSRTGAALELQLAGKPAARLDGRIDLPIERLFDLRALAIAPVQLDAALPQSALAAWGGEVVSLGGTLEGRGALHGTLGTPQWELALAATDAVVEGRPLGAVKLDASYAAGRTTVDLELRPAAGGTLHGRLALDRPLGIGTEPGPIRAAYADATLWAEGLDLGFLPALAPGVIRVASGAASVDLHAAGPLSLLRPVGKIWVAKGRLAVAELGDWTNATIEADLGEDVVELRRFDVQKGTGSLALHGTLRGLSKRDVPAELEATLRTVDFGVERAGMEFVRLDLEAEGRGTLSREGLTLGIVLPKAEVQLPKRIPRRLQETSTRKDISVGRPKPARARRPPPGTGTEGAATGTAAAAPTAPFKTVLHFVAPRRLRVRADQPRIDVELKADAILAFAGSREESTGSIQVIRGQVEPIGGRVFVLERGKVTFTGGPLNTGALDVAARYDNPKAVVWATVTGTISKPRLQLTSEPPMEEAQIAILVATGRTELKAGVGGVNTLSASDAGLAAAGAVAMGVFKDLLADKLPVDSVSLDSTAVSAGKYLTDRIYVGYVRRFDAKPEKGENPDEVRVEYQLAPGWQVETRYGSGQSGGVSIVWTRIY